MSEEEFSTISIDISEETAEEVIRMFLNENNFNAASKYQFEAALAAAREAENTNPLAQAIYEAVLNEMLLKVIIEEINKNEKVD